MKDIKKILVLDSRAGTIHKDLLELQLDMYELEGKERPKIEVKNVLGRGIAMRLPRDFEGYLLHLAQVELRRDLSALREEQPWSFIYGISGQGTVDLVPEVRNCLDRTFYIVRPFDYQEIIKDIMKGRVPQ